MRVNPARHNVLTAGIDYGDAFRCIEVRPDVLNLAVGAQNVCAP
jgi:hypothetical protein